MTFSLLLCFLPLYADEVTMKEMGDKNQQLRAGEILIIVVVLFMWAGWWESLRACERRGRGILGLSRGLLGMVWS